MFVLSYFRTTTTTTTVTIVVERLQCALLRAVYVGLPF